MVSTMDVEAIEDTFNELMANVDGSGNIKDYDFKIEKIRDSFRQHISMKKNNKSEAFKMMDEELICNLKDIQEKCLGILTKYMQLNTPAAKAESSNSYADISELIHDINSNKENINFNAWLYETIYTSFFEN